ncbi:MAG: glycosyltransferase [Planctomycetes bacterium]|nr:glycosyltransferase [Planctomycetota bacterium]
MIVVHLTASTFLGGPERQMLGLARHLDAGIRSAFLSFAEGGRCAGFLQAARIQGHPARMLAHDTPRLLGAAREITAELTRLRAGVLCCHGYKADLVGRIAARRAGIPAVAVSRGWTAENLKVRLYEWLDRVNLRWMDRVVCVSQGQAAKVCRAVSPERVEVIRNAIDTKRFADIDRRCRQRLQSFFAGPRRRIIGSAGRLSPEKGFGIFLQAARRLAARDPSLGFVHFGDGPLRKALEHEAEAAGLEGVFVFAGLRPDLDRFLPFLDLMVLPSFTEGLPNIVLEAFAAAVPVVATAVGGTPEVVEDGVNGRLVPAANAEAVADAVLDVLFCEERRRAMGDRGRKRVRDEFSFVTQARAYERLFAALVPQRTEVPVQREVA